MAHSFSIGLTAGVLAAAAAISSAGAVTITTSPAVFASSVSGSRVTSTQVTGLFDPFAFPNQATTTSIPLAAGYSLLLSTPADPAQPGAPFGDYPYAFSDGYTGDVFLPTSGLSATGTYNFVNSVTVTASSSSLSALSFEVAPFSAAANGPPNASLKGPYSLTVAAGGQSVTVSEPGANSSGVTTPAFFGLYGGGITSFTISTSDPNGLAFGDFQSVPEPASLSVMAVGLVALAGRRRRA